jgi:ferric-dicitrate binding protein FerR (iron transport regulator)
MSATTPRFSSERDLLEQPAFRKWVFRPTPELDAYWRDYLHQHPDGEDAINTARAILLAVRQDDEGKPAPRDYHEVLHSVKADRKPKRKQVSITTILVIAASVLIVLTAGLLYSKINNEDGGQEAAAWSVVSADTNGMRRLILPDSSSIVLNADATVRYSADWSRGGQREVWIEGEGFFDVVHDAEDRNFVVHTSHGRIEVLGTTFNVSSRREQTEVVLNTGSIRLIPEAEQRESLLLEPGDLVRLAGDGSTDRQRVDAEEYTAWRERMTFRNATVAEISQRIENVYGVEVVLQGTGLERRQFSFTAPTDDLDLLLLLLKRGLDIRVEQMDGVVTLSQ